MANPDRSSRRLLNRIRRIAGQVAAVERGLSADAGCSEMLLLVAAVRGAVNALMNEIIAEHLNQRVAKSGLSNADRAAAAEELIAVIRRYSK